MSEQQPFDEWEERLRETAGNFSYPPTPDIAGAVRRRLATEQAHRMPRSLWRQPRWALAALVLALVLGGLVAVPEVRAAIQRILRIGAIEIVLPTPTPAVPPSPLPPTPTLRPAEPTPPLAPTPRPSPTPLASLLDLDGETTLEDARRRTGIAIPLPTYPADLGPPDRVFVQPWDGLVTVLVWLVPGTEEQVRFSLHVMRHDALGRKFADQTTIIEETTVNGEPARWVRGPHMLWFYTRRNGLEIGRLVKGNVLIWEHDNITYRLESDLQLEEVRRIAESLR